MTTPAGYIEFVANDVLTAAQVNDRLMSQVTTVFASTAARDAAITSPAVGQVCLVTSTTDNKLYQYTAAGGWVWLRGGPDTYASKAARDAANPTPTAGQLAHKTSGKVSTIYNGTAWENVPQIIIHGGSVATNASSVAVIDYGGTHIASTYQFPMPIINIWRTDLGSPPIVIRQITTFTDSNCEIYVGKTDGTSFASQSLTFHVISFRRPASA